MASSSHSHDLQHHRFPGCSNALGELQLNYPNFNNFKINFRKARDHRVHHKYSETDADPHNATRGFFFSHVGWLLCRKHPDVIAAGKKLDISDLRADPILKFQKDHYMTLMPLLCFVLPTIIPVYCWGETWANAWFVATMFRYTFILNVTWLVS